MSIELTDADRQELEREVGAVYEQLGRLLLLLTKLGLLENVLGPLPPSRD